MADLMMDADRHDPNGYFGANQTYIDPQGPHIDRVPLQSISSLAPFSALIISIVFVIYFFVRAYLLEGGLLKKLYGTTYTNLDETARRGFVNHHIAGFTKILILVVAAYPFIDVAFGSATLHSPFAGSHFVTQGDILLVVAQMLIAMYVFELFYRPKISPISVGHHVGTIMIGQSAIAISLNLVRERDATYEFILCTVWGAFDIVSEFFPHVCIILYRVYPNDHKFLRNIFRIAAYSTFAGTMAETALTMYLFGTLWDRWTIAFKLTTPMLHLLFMSCQLWGTWNFIKMYQRQSRLLAKERRGREGEGEGDDVEKAQVELESESVKEPAVLVRSASDDESRAVESRDS